MIWLIITHTTLISLATDTQEYHEHTITGAEMDALRIINPSKLQELLASWYPKSIKTIALAFAGAPVIESYATIPKMMPGHITRSHTNGSDTYTAGIPGYLFLQYHCIFTSLGITIHTITTCTALMQQGAQITPYTLMQGCKAYEAV